MASNSPERPGKQRGPPVNGLRRDQPLFGSRRAPRSLQQPPEFLTDSLNTSYIPSPSPPKSPTRREVRAKPRQVLSNGRSVAGSLKNTPRINDENKRPPFNSSSSRRHSEQSLKPRAAQTNSSKKTPSPNKPAQSLTRTRTPSPPRGRQTLITSPVASESSPGRGYAEAYQRIVEEENLAQEDSVENMEDGDGYEFNEQDRSQDFDRLRLQRIQHSASPISLKASRRASPRGPTSDSPHAHDGANDKENVAHESDSESGVDYTENITDTSVDSGSSQYARDLQRLGALKEGAKVFSKARVGEKVGLTVENLQRRNGSNESLGSAFSAGSLSHRGSDPSVNIPKAWGRKAKPGKDWLNRINSRSGRFTGDVPKRRSSGDPMIPAKQEREWAEPIDDWIAAAAQVPLPATEEGSSQAAQSSRDSTPKTALQRSSSTDLRRQWEVNDEDFTGRSFQVSDSPPIRIRNGTLDRFRDREIENLEKRAVTTNRLGELREKGSDELLRRRPPSRSAEENGVKDDNGPHAALRRKHSSGLSSLKSEVRDSDLANNLEDTVEDTGEQIPDTPIVIHRNKSHDRSAADDKGAESEEKIVTSVPPSHERKDSHDLLKRLAKASSESPSPTKDLELEKLLPAENEEQVEQAPQIAKSSSNLKTPVITGAWVDQTMGDTPLPSKSNMNLKTPLVTGAWIDTPLPTGGRGPPMPTPDGDLEEKQLHTTAKLGATELIRRLSPNTITERPKLQNQAPLKYSGPPRPKSALEEILNDAKSGKHIKSTTNPSELDEDEDPTLHLGDSTIQSLEELIANDTDFSTLLAPTPPSAEEETTDPSSSSQGALTTTSTTSTSFNPSRLTDLQSYTHLLTRLTNLAPSIRASKKQLALLEQSISSPTGPNRTRTLTHHNQNADSECNEAGPIHDFLYPCHNCGCPGLSPTTSLPNIPKSFTTLTLPIPRLYHFPSQSHFPHPTRLGAITALLFTLLYLELWARATYCHPLYASSMSGYGVDINAPRPPFVLFKVLYRQTGLGSLWWVLRVLVRVVAGLVGWVVGFVFGGDGEGGGGGKVPVSRDARIARPSWGPDLRMMDDEFL